MPDQIKTFPASIGLILAAVLVGAMAAAAIVVMATRPPSVTSRDIGGVQIGGPFQLTDQTGASRDQTLLDGKWSAVFFGYTYCPDVCPMTAQSLSQAQAKLGAKAKDFQIVFISIDPGRDTAQQVKDWMDAQSLPAGTIALTGAQAQVDQAVKAYRAFASVSPDKANYEVQHSSTVYLMDPKGRFSKALVFNAPPDQLAAQIKAAMDGA